MQIKLMTAQGTVKYLKVLLPMVATAIKTLVDARVTLVSVR